MRLAPKFESANVLPFSVNCADPNPTVLRVRVRVGLGLGLGLRLRLGLGSGLEEKCKG